MCIGVSPAYDSTSHPRLRPSPAYTLQQRAASAAASDDVVIRRWSTDHGCRSNHHTRRHVLAHVAHTNTHTHAYIHPATAHIPNTHTPHHLLCRHTITVPQQPPRPQRQVDRCATGRGNQWAYRRGCLCQVPHHARAMAWAEHAHATHPPTRPPQEWAPWVPTVCSACVPHCTRRGPCIQPLSAVLMPHIVAALLLRAALTGRRPDQGGGRYGLVQPTRLVVAEGLLAEGLLAHAAAARCLAAVLPQLLRGSMVRAVCLHTPP